MAAGRETGSRHTASNTSKDSITSKADQSATPILAQCSPRDYAPFATLHLVRSEVAVAASTMRPSVAWRTTDYRRADRALA